MARQYHEDQIKLIDGVWHYPWTDDETGATGEDLETEAERDARESAPATPAAPAEPVATPAPTFNAGGVSTPVITPAQAEAAIAATPAPAVPVGEAPFVPTTGTTPPETVVVGTRPSGGVVSRPTPPGVEIVPTASTSGDLTAGKSSENVGRQIGGITLTADDDVIFDNGQVRIWRGGQLVYDSSRPGGVSADGAGGASGGVAAAADDGADAATQLTALQIALAIAQQNIALMQSAGRVPVMRWNAEAQRWEPTDQWEPTLAAIKQQIDTQRDRIRDIVEVAKASGRIPRIRLSTQAGPGGQTLDTIDVERDGAGNVVYDESMESRAQRLTAQTATGFVSREFRAPPTGTAAAVQPPADAAQPTTSVLERARPGGAQSLPQLPQLSLPERPPTTAIPPYVPLLPPPTPPATGIVPTLGGQRQRSQGDVLDSLRGAITTPVVEKDVEEVYDGT